jgi:arylsulfatase A-like enzyme
MNRKPNIILLQTDQHRWDALGCVNPVIKTPRLDALAARGVRFSQAICNNPMCVPSRYSMMTGLYSSQCGVRHNTQMCENDEQMPIATLAERLRAAGYATAGFGKTHWYCGIPDEHNPAKVPHAKPSLRGFDVRAESVMPNPAGLGVRGKMPRHLLLHMTIAWSRFPRPYSYTDLY